MSSACARSSTNAIPNLEYIVVDAGSTDGSAELLRNYQARHECFSHLIIEPDHGQSDGLNKGFRLATGEILTWVNSDDMLAPLSLKRAAMALRETGADMVTGTCRRVCRHARRPTLQAFRGFADVGGPKSFQLKAPLNWCEFLGEGRLVLPAGGGFHPRDLGTRGRLSQAASVLGHGLGPLAALSPWRARALSAFQMRSAQAASMRPRKPRGEELYLWQIVGILREYDELLAKLSSVASSRA